jgi:hypothetical protein
VSGTYGERRGAYRDWWGNLRVKGLLERHRCRLEDNVEVHVKKIVLERVKWIDLAENMYKHWAVLNTVVNFRIP